jgi:hypothetical protein
MTNYEAAKMEIFFTHTHTSAYFVGTYTPSTKKARRRSDALFPSRSRL